ncbi:hypothetical protein [Saccharothrix sp. Mg75]|uniref:hypothetical protein n=1 Tax=Saccharothrix sp. Mg75 TaxID=3445357 RepID=UPI003EEC844C
MEEVEEVALSPAEDDERLHEVPHVVSGLRRAGRNRSLLDEVHRRLSDAALLERPDLAETAWSRCTAAKGAWCADPGHGAGAAGRPAAPPVADNDLGGRPRDPRPFPGQVPSPVLSA